MHVYPRSEDYVIYEGQSFTAEWYYSTEGKMPAFEYYESLSKTDQERLDKMIIYFCDLPYGMKTMPIKWYRIEDDVHQIYALKPRDERFFNFMSQGAKIIITNAYHKHSQKMTRIDREQLGIAVRYRQDYLQRVKEATYYAR